MMTFKEFAAKLAKAEKQVIPGLIDDLTEVGLRQVNLAKSFIGQELPEWPPLADVTVEEKERLGYTGVVSETDPLLRTGKMRDSIEAVVRKTYNGAELEVGSNDPVAIDQEMGTVTIPPRPFLALSAIQITEFFQNRLAKRAVSLMTGKKPE